MSTVLRSEVLHQLVGQLAHSLKVFSLVEKEILILKAELEYPGTRENFVFSLAPEMAVYSSTGFNDHYQYLNIQQQTFPNGMVRSFGHELASIKISISIVDRLLKGFGGQLDYFAIWIDSEYG